MPVSERAYVSGHFALELNGEKSGLLKSVEGGGAKAEVVTESPGAFYHTKKHLGPVSYEPITMQIDLNMTKSVYAWISDSWAGDYQPQNGSIVALDMQYKSVSEQEFLNALITELTIPAMDGSSKDAAFMTVKFAPEITRRKKGDGTASTKPTTKAQKRWITNNFRLEIDGLDCQKVSKIDSFTVKRKSSENSIGETRDYEKEPTSVEFPNLTITINETGAQSWYDWHEDFVIKGNNADEKEKKGTLIFLLPDLKTELARVNFFNLGIFNLAPVKVENSADQIKRVKAELYCERMEFELK